MTTQPTMHQPTSRASRRDFLKTSAAVAGLAGLSACAGEAKKPNILWIIAEDFSPDLGCYGEPVVQTPRIDGLAAEGVRYDHACVTAPICSIARSALMTGMYQTSIGAHHHRSHREDDYKLPEGVRPFTALLREAGYHTSNLKGTPVGGRGKTDFNFNLDEPPFDGADWTERAEGQPFYAQINFSETHRAFAHDPDHPIDPAEVQLPPYYPDHPVARQEWQMYLETTQILDGKVGAVLDRLEEQGLAEDTIVFFFGDHGRPMPRGKQFLYEGGVLIPLIVRIPEKYRPADWTAGSGSDRLVSHIDITATTLAYAGVPRPESMEARVFFGPEEDAAREMLFFARDRADETVDHIRGARTREYKYIRNLMPERPYTQPNNYKDTSYPMLQLLRQLHAEDKLTTEQALFMSERRPEEELYDLKADPYELHNLAGSPDHADKLAEMRGALDTWIVETDDKGQTLEGPLPASYDVRTEVDGWTTVTGVMSKQDGKLHCEWRSAERPNVLQRPWIAEPGPMRLTYRSRYENLAPKALTWGVVDNVRGNGNRIELEAAQEGSWTTQSVEFEPTNWLSIFTLEFDPGEGLFELEWAKLETADGKLIHQFELA